MKDSFHFFFFSIWVFFSFSYECGVFCIENFRNSKSLCVMEEDVSVLKQLLSNTAWLFHNQPALPTHCSEMHVISR